MSIKKTFAFLLSAILLLPMGILPAAAEETKSPLDGMTLEEKLGQMLMPSIRTWDGKNVTAVTPEIAEAIETLRPGGIILFAQNTPGTESTVQLTCDLQSASMRTTGCPLLISIDQEGGYVTRLGTGTMLCGNMALGATQDADLARRAAGIIGGELAALGINVDFAPVLDVNNNPNNPVIGVRSFSDDPTLVGTMGAAFLAGLHDQGVAAALKHFPGHGDTATNSHSGLPCINKTLGGLEACELIPFAESIAAGADIVMTAHICYPQIETATYTSVSTGEEITLPATLSKTILTDLLRGKLGFDGVICTDAMNMDAIATHFDRLDAARLAINAGADILLMSVTLDSAESVADAKQYLADLAALVRSGAIDEERVDDAVMRILRLKERYGDYAADREGQILRALATVGSRADHEAEREITERAVTLVKNDGMLPLQSGESVVLFASYANEVTAMEYAVRRLKADGTIPQDTSCRFFCYQKMTAPDEEMRKAIREASAVVASVETTSAASMNAAQSGGWQAAFCDELIAFAHENGKKAAILSIQLPYDLARFQAADALLAAYCCKGMNVDPTTFEGETAAYGPNLPAAVGAVFGAFAPTGKLPVNVPMLDGNAYSDEILYPRGHGLTFADKPTFGDVPADAYYAPAVRWAVQKGITSGVSEAEFAPDAVCTRAQAVTLLWRMAGSPAVDYAIFFKDVPVGTYYTEAVRWAAAMNISSGTPRMLFEPDAACTRAEIVTFLWRMAGKPEADGAMPFGDVSTEAWYAPAVRWAVAEGITSGVSETEFAPDAACTRAQIVTFLQRYAK